jgi:hypothetical protein
VVGYLESRSGQRSNPATGPRSASHSHRGIDMAVGIPGVPTDLATGRLVDGRRRRRPSWWRGRRLAATAVAVAVTAAITFTAPGAAVASAGYRFLEYYTGVFALVALSLTVMGGLSATNRSVLLARHRVLLQTAHRLTALLALGCLVVHITLKVVETHASALDVFVPFLSPHRRLFMGLGTIAFYLMVFLAWTGVIRARFAQSPRPWLWRVMHIAAYPAWLLAIVHGLSSGRHAAAWVSASYALCAAAVALGLLVRVGVARGRRTASTTGIVRPVPADSAHVAAGAAATQTVGLSSPAVRPKAVPAGSPVVVPPRPPVCSAPAASRTSVPPAPVAPPRRRRGASRVPPPPRTPLEDASDDEFWIHMRGDALR